MVVVGRSASSPEGTELVRADLSTLAGTAQAADDVATLVPEIDWLVLGAGRFNRRRTVTADGLEHTFALYPVSRYLLTDRLLPLLTADAVIVSLCGVAGLGGPGIQWHDLTLSGRYRAFGAVSQGARAADLLGAGFHERYAGSMVRYVLHNPMFVDSGLGRQVGGASGRVLDAVARFLGQPPDTAASLVEPFLVRAGAAVAPLTVSRRGMLLGIDRPELDRTAAARLYEVLEGVTAGHR